jgi:hypothetical protein
MVDPESSIPNRRIGHAIAAVVVSVVVGVGPASHAVTLHEREFALQHMFEYSLHASKRPPTVAGPQRSDSHPLSATGSFE